MLGPPPAAPEVELPDAIRGDEAPHGESFGDKAWRQVFKDDTLASLIERGLRHNPDMVAASFRIEQARAAANVTRADGFPAVDARADATTDYSPARPNGRSRSSESYDLTGLLSWEIDLWGRIRRGNEAARSRLIAAQYEKDAVQTGLVAAIAAAYIELQNLDERLAISRRTVQSRQESLDLVIERRDGGVSSELEVGQAEALLGEARAAIPATEQAVAGKENEIRFLIGEFPASVVRGGSLEGLERSLRIRGGLPSTLLERRPDVAAASHAYQAAVAEIGVAEALRLPALALTGNGGVLSNRLDNLLESGSTFYSVGPRLAGPVFDAGRGRARVEAARARAGEARAAHERAAQLAFLEAADAIHAHVKTGEIITEQQRLLDALRKVSEVANDRFVAGESSYLEVLDAERSLFSAELQLADARRNRLLAVVRTYRALGGGWK